MSATISLRAECLHTSGRSQRRLLSLRSVVPDVETFALRTARLARGESIALSFDKLLFCSVNQPTLIRLTTGGNTVEFTITSSLVLPSDGHVEFINPEDSTIVLPINVSYVAV